MFIRAMYHRVYLRKTMQFRTDPKYYTDRISDDAFDIKDFHIGIFHKMPTLKERVIIEKEYHNNHDGLYSTCNNT